MILRTAIVLLALPLLGKELISNGDFRKGMTGWQLFTYNAFQGKVSPKIQRHEGKPTFVTEIPDIEATNNVLLHQFVNVEEGKTYKVSLECRVEDKGQMAIRVTQTKPPHDHYGCNRGIRPDTQWKRYEVTFKCKATDAQRPPALRVVMGHTRGKVFIRKVSVQELPTRSQEHENGDLTITNLNAARKAQPTSQATSATELAAAFTRDAASAEAAFKGTAVRVRGRVTKIEAALADDILIELDGGRVSILVAGGEISEDQERFVKGQLAAARRQSRPQAYPIAELTGAISGFRKDSVKMRQGKNVTFEKGQ